MTIGRLNYGLLLPNLVLGSNICQKFMNGLYCYLNYSTNTQLNNNNHNLK